jgi:glycosyltransferase involved in cell wall biosynthesis
MSKPSLVIFSPLPPSRNGIADYTKALIDELNQYYNCIVVIANDAPAPDHIPASVIFEAEYTSFFSSFAPFRHLYLLGNNTTHRYVLNHLSLVPGIVTIHDLTLSHLIGASVSGGAGSSHFRSMVGKAYGELGMRLVGYGDGSSALATELPMLDLIGSGALAVITLSQFARCRLAGSRLACSIFVIPHPRLTLRLRRSATPPAENGAGPLRLACFGFITRSKRIDLTLEAVRHLRLNGIEVTLTVGGERRPDDYDIDRDIERLGLAEFCRVLDYLTEEDLTEEIGRADIVVNLRLPTFGETSGTLTRAMAAGKCAIVTDHGSYSELPADAVVKISLAEMTGYHLAERLYPLLRDADLRKAVGARARDYVESYLSPRVVAERYRGVIESVYSDRAPCRHCAAPACVSLLPRSERLRVESEAVALGVSGSSDPNLWWSELRLACGSEDGSLLIVGGDERAELLAARAFHWSRIRRIEHRSLLSLDGVFDAALVLRAPASRGALCEFLSGLVPYLADYASLTLEFVSLGTWLDDTAPSNMSRIAEDLRCSGFELLEASETTPVSSLTDGRASQLRNEWCVLAYLKPILRERLHGAIGRMEPSGSRLPS